MEKIFNKTYFKFFFRFVILIAMSLAGVFIATQFDQNGESETAVINIKE